MSTWWKNVTIEWFLHKWWTWFRNSHGRWLTDLCIFPQIAGSYRGSYFSMPGLLIPKIAKWSWCRCRLVLLHLSPCMISILGCSWLPLPPCLASFVSLHDLHSGLLFAAAAACSCCICLPSWSPFWAPLGCRCRLCLLHLSPFMISILGSSWLPLPPCLPSFSPFMISVLGCS